MVVKQREDLKSWLPAMCGAVLIYSLLLVAHGPLVLQGNLSNSDDLMRMAQVRDLLGGQSWFDVTQSRLVTPEGGAMHWSRIPDVFIGGLVLLATPFAGPESAEVFAALVWPALVLLALVGGLLVLVRRFGGGLTGQVIAIVTVATFAPIYQFWPGRIDHHGFNAVLTVWALCALTWSARPVLGAALTGIVAVALLSVALEALPMALGLMAGVGIWWLNGNRDQETAAFGGSVLFAAPIFALLDAPGWTMDARAVCDAYGWAHMQAFMVAGIGLGVIGALGGHLNGIRLRLGVAVAVGGLVLALAAVLARDCLADPYASVSSTAREAWLSLVSEARSLPSKYADSPTVAIFYFAPPLMAAIALTVLVWRRRSMELAVTGVMLALALVVTLWQVRAMIFAQVLAVVPASLAGAALLSHWRTSRGPVPLLAAVAVLLVLSPMAWLQVSSSAFPAPAEAGIAAAPGQYASPGEALAACQSKATMAELASLERGKVFTSIDLGASVILHTPHDATVAPYHRNVEGIAAAADTWASRPDKALATLRSGNVDYVVFCPGLAENEVHARRGQDGLAALLMAGDVPAGLEKVSVSDGLDIYRVSDR